MNKHQIQGWACFMFLIAFAISLEQYIDWGSWFELKDIHHEMFIVMFAFAGILLFWITRRKSNE